MQSVNPFLLQFGTTWRKQVKPQPPQQIQKELPQADKLVLGENPPDELDLGESPTEELSLEDESGQSSMSLNKSSQAPGQKQACRFDPKKGFETCFQ